MELYKDLNVYLPCTNDVFRYPDDKSSFLSPSAKNNLLANNPQKSDPMKTNIPLTKNNVRKKMYI